MMKAAVLAAVLVAACGSGLTPAGATASASETTQAAMPAAAGPSSDGPGRHVVALEFCSLHSAKLCWMTQSSRFFMTQGPSLWGTHLRWSRWGNRSADGSGTMWAADAAKWRVGHVTIQLYRPRSYVTISGARHPYFTRAHIIGGRGIAHHWRWLWSGSSGFWAGMP